MGQHKAVRRLSDTICIENGLSIVENPKPHGKSYNKWLGDQAKPSRRSLRVTIDNALSQSPANFEELLKRCKSPAVKLSKRREIVSPEASPGWEKQTHLDSLGEDRLEDFTGSSLREETHTPRKEVVAQAEPPKVNLLVDIQAKLQAGKGAGYARWAKVFNLKQMAQTIELPVRE